LKRAKLGTEVKLLLVIAFILGIGFGVINFISIRAYKAQLFQKINSEASLYQVLLLYSTDIPFPPYFKLSERIPLDYDSWKIAGKTNDMFLLVNLNYLRKEVFKYSMSLFLWELPVWLLTILVVYRTVSNFIRREKETKELVKLFFLLFTHKLGNFLSLDRLSIELLIRKYGMDKPLVRLRRSYKILEEDFKKSLKYIEALEIESKPELVDVGELIKELTVKYHTYFPDRRLELHLNPVKVKAVKADVESLFQLLIENAFKYSASFVKVESFRQGKGYTVVLTNDVGGGSSGSGIGLKMVEFLAKKLGWKMKVYPSDNKFTVELKLN